MSHHETTATTGRLRWLLLGFAAGAVTAHLADPDRGDARRTEIRQRVTGALDDATDRAATAADRAGDRAQGIAAETRRAVTPQDVPENPDVLRQRIKSEAFGHHDDTDDVVVMIAAPGEVVLRGTVRSEASRDQLLDAVGDVEGVADLRSELTVAA